MSKSYIVNAPLDHPLNSVLYMVGDDNYADVWLRKDVHEDTVTEYTYDPDSEESTPVENRFQTALEIHFRVDPAVISEDDITANFDKYWAYGEQWADTADETNAEKIQRLLGENENLRQCIAEISDLL